MCKPFQSIVRCRDCDETVAPLESWGWIPCPEFKRGHLKAPKDCSVADWDPGDPVEFDSDQPHQDCKAILKEDRAGPKDDISISKKDDIGIPEEKVPASERPEPSVEATDMGDRDDTIPTRRGKRRPDREQDFKDDNDDTAPKTGRIENRLEVPLQDVEDVTEPKNKGKGRGRYRHRRSGGRGR